MTAAGAVYTLVQGITYPLLALTLQRGGASSTAVGISAAMTPAGMLLAAAGLPALARRIPPVAIVLSCFVLAAVLLPPPPPPPQRSAGSGCCWGCGWSSGCAWR